MTHPGAWYSFLWGPPKATFPSGCFGGDRHTQSLVLQSAPGKREAAVNAAILMPAFLGEIARRHRA